MDISKEYFLSRLANGENINDIGNEIAEMMNAAVAEQEAARKAEAAKAANLAAQKKAVGLKIVDLFREYATLTGNDVMNELEVTDADLDTLIEALDQTFTLMSAMKDLKDAINAIPDEKVPMVHAKLHKAKVNAKSDDEVLADFIASLAR